MTDLDALTRSEAAQFVNMSESGLWKLLARNRKLHDAVVVDMGRGATVRISLPRLCRHMHGAEADALIPAWRDQIAAQRSQKHLERSAS